MSREELNEGEHHPSTWDAFKFIKGLSMSRLSMAMEAFSSCAIEGNRLAELCAGTLQRIMSNQAVGERYILGLAWELKKMFRVEDSDIL